MSICPKFRTPMLSVGSAFLFACFAPISAAADETNETAAISGSIGFELQNDLAFDSDDEAEEFNNLFVKVEPTIKWSLTKEFSATAALVFEQVQEPAIKGDNRTFDDQGLYVSDLTLDYESGPLRLSGGKMGVNFGTAWDLTPGIYGTDLAEEYEISENISLLAAYTLGGGESGSHTVTAQTFFADTSGLAESAFTRRQKTREGDNGPGNTGDFSSFSIAVDGSEFSGLPGFAYHVAYARLKDEAINSSDESRLAFGLRHEFAIAQDITMQPLIEYTMFKDADGTRNQDRSYLTFGSGFAYGNWNAAASATLKETDAADGTETEEEHLQVSLGYAFTNGLALDVGYKRSRNAGVDTDVVGAKLSYGYDF